MKPPHLPPTCTHEVEVARGSTYEVDGILYPVVTTDDGRRVAYLPPPLNLPPQLSWVDLDRALVAQGWTPAHIARRHTSIYGRIHGGLAFFVAIELDPVCPPGWDGVHVRALDPTTGVVLHDKVRTTPALTPEGVIAAMGDWWHGGSR